MRSDRFKKLVEQNPENELYRFSLAQALVKEDRPAEAEPHLRACIEKRSDWMVAYIMLGKALVDLGRSNEARPIFESALQLAIEQQHEDPEAELRALLEQMS
jgi:predicted Zn-dependent protease